MSLIAFLDDFVSLNGADALEGAVVLVNLDRGTDQLIRRAMEADPRHKGSEHRWSHTILVAEPWRGPDTRILDMTIRDEHGGMEWSDKAASLLGDALLGIAGKAGGVYSGTIADYEHPKTVDYGVKWIRDLSAEQRRLIVRKGLAVQADGYHYDFPGLLRELARFLVGAKIQAGKKLLFCSAFCQRAYRDALSRDGDFAESLVAADTTPDDIWYSVVGDNFPALPPDAVRTRAIVGRSGVAASRMPDGVPEGLFPVFVGSVEPTASPLVSGPPAGGLAERVDRLLRGGASGRGVRDDDVQLMLERLQDRIARAGDDPIAYHDSRATDPDDILVSLARSLADEDAGQVEPETAMDVIVGTRGSRGGGPVIGTGDYEALDIRWAAALANRLKSPPADYPTAAPRVIDAGASARVGLIGDWGTGSPASDLLALRLAQLDPAYTIHLGDVYYSGTESECRRFVDRWPKGKRGSFAINSNHEMYSGGRGYFEVTLASEPFAAQGGAPSFALVAGKWRILGLDSAYYALHYMYDRGMLGPKDAEGAQRAWLSSQIASAKADGQRVVLLSHHHGLEESTEPTRFWSEVTRLVQELDGDTLWYWGHVHAGMAFHPRNEGVATIHGRCAGHGGVPWRPFDADERKRFAWGEDRLAGDPTCPRRALNGFVTLDIDGPALTERFYDERGDVCYTRTFA